MDEIRLMDMVERYLRGEMEEEERILFAEMRREDQRVDQLIVEHQFFLNQFDLYQQKATLARNLDIVHQKLQASDNIQPLPAPSKIAVLWKRYKKTVSVAASIAGITALAISGMFVSLTPKADIAQIENLGRKIDMLERNQNSTRKELTDVKNKIEIPGAPAKFGGTGFLIDPKGYLVTNAHVVEHAGKITVQNKSGIELAATVVYKNGDYDLAILKIVDSIYKTQPALPYSISKKNVADLAEPIFTLGYPREEIVYGEGYLSAVSGYMGDTLSYQLSISANPGNSGGPVLNKDGEIIGVLTNRQTTADGVVFAIRSNTLLNLVEELKSDSTIIKVPTGSLKTIDRKQQVKKMTDYVFMVKGY